MKVSRPASTNRDLVLTLWLGWLVFVVYGSLVPLDFQGLPWEEALDRFAHIRLLDVGVQGRGDWVSNGVLYVPVGLFSMLLLVQRAGLHRLAAAGVSLVLALALAVGVEFTQLFFPPRTVSLNDLLAEALGGFTGIVLAWSSPKWLPTLERSFSGRGPMLAAALLPMGVVALLLLALFPFDFLLSHDELSAKLGGDLWGWWVSSAVQRSGLLAVMARWAAEVVVIVPLGLIWARSQHFSARAGLWPVLMRAVVVGAVVGAVVELGQLLIASGVSQGASVLSRALGWALGTWLWQLRDRWGVAEWRTGLRRHALLLGMLHALAVLLLSGWASGSWRSLEEALVRLTGAEIRFVPFYYHYYTSEAVALQSLLSTALLYAPIGLLGWALGLSPRVAAVWAGLLAVLTEAGKLFPQGVRPDPTNVGISMVAAGLALIVLQLASGERRELQRASDSGTAASWAVDRAWGFSFGWLALAVALTAVWLVNFPVWRPGVAVLLVAGVALVWWRPVALMAVVVAALPLLNLSLWSGREYLDEFDVLVLLCLVAALAAPRPAGGIHIGEDRFLKLGMFAVFACTSMAALMGWAPWHGSALGDPSSPLSPWMSLRLFKGVLWAGALYLVARRQRAMGLPVMQSFSVGMVLGLLGLVAVVLWERITFVGLWDTTSPYRVAGPVLPMRLGGAYLDVFLIAGLSFAWLGLLNARNGIWRALCGFSAVGAIYAVAATYTRTTYLAAALVTLIFFLFSTRGTGSWLFRRSWPVGLLLLVSAFIAYFFGAGSFVQARFAMVQADLTTRMTHMEQVIEVAQASGHHPVWGRGLGRYPSDNYWVQASGQQTESNMAVHKFGTESGVGVLQIGPGKSLYVDQAIAWQSTDSGKVHLRVRSGGQGGQLRVLLCEKWLLASANCAAEVLALPQPGQGWVQVSLALASPSIDASTRPIRFSLSNAGPVRIDIDSVSLLDGRGVELLRNGGFDKGSDHWSYTSDDHLAWHVKNMALAIWFDMGWIGVLAFSFLLALALKRSSRAAWSGDRSAQALLAALSGLLVVSVFDSVVDEPRFLLLLLLLAWLAATPAGPGKVTGRETLA